MDVLKTDTHYLPLYSFQELPESVRSYALKTARHSNDYNQYIENVFLAEGFNDFKAWVEELGIHIFDESVKIDHFDGIGYSATVDIQTLIQCTQDQIKDMYPEQYYDLRYSNILPEIIGYNKFDITVTVTVTSPYNSPQIWVSDLPAGWKDAIIEYVRSVLSPLNRGLMAEWRGHYMEHKATYCMQEIFSTGNFLFTKQGILIPKATLEF